MHRRCPRCGETKPTSGFYWLKLGRHDRYCKECRRALTKEWRERNPGRHDGLKREWSRDNPAKVAFYNRKSRYGIIREQYDALVKAQGGRCAICRKPAEPLDIDHQHSTKLIRGLLCGRCNRGLGHFQDDPALLLAAAMYLLSAGSTWWAGAWWPAWALGPDGRPNPPHASGDG